MLLPFIEGGTIKANNFVRCPQIVMSRKAKFNFINILTQNARGIKSSKRINELSDQILKHNTFALCIQETWKQGDSIELSNDCTFLLHGIPQKVDTGRRGKGGVGIDSTS